MENGLWSLTGKVALVSGGSKGIGLAAVSALLHHGASVLSTARNGEILKKSVHKWQEQGLPVAAPLRKPASPPMPANPARRGRAEPAKGPQSARLDPACQELLTDPFWAQSDL